MDNAGERNVPLSSGTLNDERRPCLLKARTCGSLTVATVLALYQSDWLACRTGKYLDGPEAELGVCPASEPNALFDDDTFR